MRDYTLQTDRTNEQTTDITKNLKLEKSKSANQKIETLLTSLSLFYSYKQVLLFSQLIPFEVAEN